MINALLWITIQCIQKRQKRLCDILYGSLENESYQTGGLGNHFSNDFLLFTANDFKLIYSVTRRRLREVLRDRDVYCEN